MEQTDIHNPQATVQEAFLFAAELRNPEAHVQSMPAFVEDALATLELTAQAHLLVRAAQKFKYADSPPV